MLSKLVKRRKETTSEDGEEERHKTIRSLDRHRDKDNGALRRKKGEEINAVDMM